MEDNVKEEPATTEFGADNAVEIVACPEGVKFVVTLLLVKSESYFFKKVNTYLE